MAARRYGGEIGWLQSALRRHFRDRQVLELGSGLGRRPAAAAGGAAWTFADIVPDNPAVIRRIASLKRLEPRGVST